MKENEIFQCVGDLSEEIREIKKISNIDEVLERGRTTTSDCMLFLTIFCC